MTGIGKNLPDFTARQLEFAAHIRNPSLNPAPLDVDPRRMKMYVDLIFNNIEGLLASAFPVTRVVLGMSRWSGLVRQFLQRHPSVTPYFLEISEEFIAFVHGLRDSNLPGFLAELCHYEWVELGLDVAEYPALADDLDPRGNLLQGLVIRSPVAWPLRYAYPVHRIGQKNQPEAPGESPTFLVVYRGTDDRVHFMEVNALTLRLIVLLDGSRTGSAALAALAGELPDIGRARVLESGEQLLESLRAKSVLVGARPAKQRPSLSAAGA